MSGVVFTGRGRIQRLRGSSFLGCSLISKKQERFREAHESSINGGYNNRSSQ